MSEPTQEAMAAVERFCAGQDADGKDREQCTVGSIGGAHHHIGPGLCSREKRELARLLDAFRLKSFGPKFSIFEST